MPVSMLVTVMLATEIPASLVTLAVTELALVVRSVFPLGARAGETVEIQFLGRHLDGTTEMTFARKDIRAEVLSSDYFRVKARIALGPNVPAGLHDYRVRTGRGTYVGV